MKWLFITLLLFNVCYLGWEINKQATIDIKHSNKPLNVEASVHKLQLLSQSKKKPAIKMTRSARLNKQQTTAAQHIDDREPAVHQEPTNNIESVKQQSAVITNLQFTKRLITKLPTAPIKPIQKTKNNTILCITLGPFVDTEKIDTLDNWLKKQNIQSKKRVQEEDGYFWIYLASNKWGNDAKLIARNLQSQGIKDYQIIDKGDLKNAISLGVFSNQLMINKRLAEIRKIGYQPILVPYYKKESLTWIDIKIDNNKTTILSELVNGYPAKFNAMPLQCNNFNT